MAPEVPKSHSHEVKSLLWKRWLKPLAIGVIVGAALITMAVILFPSMFSLLPPGLFVTIPAGNNDECMYKPPAGIRPLCAVTSWNDGSQECTIVNYNGDDCDCYAGQTRTCRFANPAQRCTPPSDTCGSKSCVATDDTHADWGPCLPVVTVAPTATALPTTIPTAPSPP
jgi:hypothetical protein